MADKNLLQIGSTNVSNSSDQVHIVRGNQDFRMNAGLLQSGAAAELITGNAILKGGVIYTGTGLNYYVWASRFIINSNVYDQFVSDTVTLSDGDASDDRFDVFAIQVNGAFDGFTPISFEVIVIEGTPSGNPLLPTLDLVKQVQSGFRLVAALETVDVTTNINLVYDENVEWTNTTLTTGGNLNESADPFTGVKNFKTPATELDSVSWTDSGLTVFNPKDTLSFALRTTLTSKSRIQIKLINSSNSQYWLKTLNPGEFNDFGFVETPLLWQLTQINLSDFQPSSRSETQFDRIEFTFINTLSLELDKIEFQGDLEQGDGGLRQRDLIDTPNSYSGKAGQIQKMNAGENAWEFTTLPATFLHYVGTLSQSGTNDPVLTEQINTLGVTPNFVRTSIGQYEWDARGESWYQNPIVFFIQNKPSIAFTIRGGFLLGWFQIATGNTNGSSADSQLGTTVIEIKVYT